MNARGRHVVLDYELRVDNKIRNLSEKSTAFSTEKQPLSALQPFLQYNFNIYPILLILTTQKRPISMNMRRSSKTKTLSDAQTGLYHQEGSLTLQYLSLGITSEVN